MKKSLDDDAAAVLDALADGRQPPTRTLAATAARRQLATTLEAATVPELPDVREVTIPAEQQTTRDGTMTLRLYYPEETGSAPCLAYFHGGGWIEGDLETHDALCRRLAIESDCVVAAVEYRRAPEQPFPAGLEDCYTAFRWLAEHGHHVDIETDALAVAGDSAGGALAAGVSLRAAQHGGPTIDHQLLVCPMLRSPVQEAFDSLGENATGGFLETATVEYFHDQYCDSPAAYWNGAAFPLLVEDCSVFPETTVLTAGHDPLRDEGQAFADRLDDAGVTVECHNAADQPHVFVLFADRIAAGAETIEWLGDRIRAGFE